MNENPESMRLKRGPWLCQFDAEAFAKDHYLATVSLTTTPPKSTTVTREYYALLRSNVRLGSGGMFHAGFCSEVVDTGERMTVCVYFRWMLVSVLSVIAKDVSCIGTRRHVRGTYASSLM